MSLKILIDNILYDVINYKNNKVVAVNLFNFDGEYKIIKDVLIIDWANNITHFYIKNNINIYEHYNFEYFDLDYYNEKYGFFLNWNNCFEHWIIEGRPLNFEYNIFLYILDDDKILKIYKKYNSNYLVINNIFIKYIKNINLYTIEEKIFYEITINDTLYLINNNYKYLSTKYFKKDKNYFMIDGNYLINLQIPKNFDWKFYRLNVDDLNFDNCNSIYDAYEHYLIYDNEYLNKCILQTKNKTYNIILNITDEQIYGIHDKKIEFLKINNNILCVKWYDELEIITYAKYENTYFEVNINLENVIKTNYVYIISNLSGGGSLKYLKDIEKMYNNNTYIYIRSDKELNDYDYVKNSILFVQHLFFTDIQIKNILKIAKKYDLKIIITVHDYSWYSDTIMYDFKEIETMSWHSNYLKNINIHTEIIELFNDAFLIIAPSIFMYNLYLKWFNLQNIILSYHIDILLDHKSINYKTCDDKIINIGIMTELTKCKGLDFINHLKNNYVYFDNVKINFITINYKYEDFYKKIENLNIHGLINLNMYAETYCYFLSLAINSGLPFLYNNFGAFKERITHKRKHYFKCFNDENEVNNYTKLNIIFEKYICFIINIKQNTKNIKEYIENNNNNNIYDKLFA
jgi:hypothetical protein